jgi:hypothetical protein
MYKYMEITSIQDKKMGISTNAQLAEKLAFEKLSKKLGETIAFAKPAGFDVGFPDFGIRMIIDNRKVDLHIEYKADSKAQMGSMRDWVFDGTRFSSPDRVSEEKKDLIALMNASPECIKNGKRLLKDFKKHSDSKITKIYSGMMTIEKDQKVRRKKLESFAANTENYQLAKIQNLDLGKKIIDHYESKFKISEKSDADYSMLMMMIDNEIWFIKESGTASKDLKSKILDRFGVKQIPVLSNLSAALEVRIQPRGLTSPGKPVSVDVMSSYRLSGKPSNGYKVI